MKTRLIIFLSLFVFSFAKAQPTDTVNQLKKEVTTNLTDNILPFWLNYTVDPAGGFYGVVNNDGTPVADAEKGSILNARILWTFSKAYGKFGYERYRQAADRAAAYVIQHFIDAKYGGVYWSLDSEGRMKDGTKQTYALAFTIYGLAEHFRVTGDKKSLDAALSLYQTLETKVHDHHQLGYIENFQRDYTRTQTKGVDGIYGSEGPLRPTQRFFNLRQLALTPADAFAVPVSCDKDRVNVAAFSKQATGESALQIVNNAASCQAVIQGLPASATQAIVYVTNATQHGEAQLLSVQEGSVVVDMPADSFVTVLVK